jgi:hypothetical protein
MSELIKLKDFYKTINRAILWIAKDLRRKNKKLTHTIFDASELNESAALSLSPSNAEQLMDYLVMLNYIVRTEKIGPSGNYYNVHRKVFNVLHKSELDKKFVKDIKAPETGYCLTRGENKTFRMICAGKQCKFYFSSEKKCVQGKFFMK